MQGEEKNVEREKLFYFALSLQRLLSTAFLPSCVLCLPHHSHGAQWGPRHPGKVNLLMSLVLCILSAHFVGPNRCHWVSKYRCFDYFQRFSYLNRGHINIHVNTSLLKNPKHQHAQPDVKVLSETGYSCHILFVYLFIYFLLLPGLFSTSKEDWNKW